MASTRERRRQRTEDAILAAALGLVNEGGPEALAMRELADRIDYSPAAIYEYFDGKDAIIAVLCEQGEERLAGFMNSIDRSLPLQDYMMGIGRAYIRFARDYPDHFLLMFNSVPVEAGAMPDEGMLEAGSSFGILVAGIRRGIEEGAFKTRPGFNWLEMAYTAWATVHGLAMLRSTRLRDIDYDFDGADRQALANFYRGLTA
jgi:AcrR family transcriptional regulator